MFRLILYSILEKELGLLISLFPNKFKLNYVSATIITNLLKGFEIVIISNFIKTPAEIKKMLHEYLFLIDLFS